MAKVTPTVTGLLPARERGPVLRLLAGSVVFLTPSNIVEVLRTAAFPQTALSHASLYLLSCGTVALSDDAPRLVGLSEGARCYVSMEYVRTTERYSDFLVHEAAHVFHNWKRSSVGLPETRRREWLPPIDFRKRETFAYACEAFSRILELSRSPEERRRRLEEAKAEESGLGRWITVPIPTLSFYEYLRIRGVDVPQALEELNLQAPFSPGSGDLGSIAHAARPLRP